MKARSKWVQTVDMQNSIRQVSYLHIPREDCPHWGFRRITKFGDPKCRDITLCLASHPLLFLHIL